MVTVYLDLIHYGEAIFDKLTFLVIQHHLGPAHVGLLRDN